MQYQPGTNSLSVFVDGVNQYGPGALYAYVETDSDTITFVSGLHVGASVKFTTSQLNTSGSVDAAQVSYDPPFVGSVPTNVEDKLAQTVSVKDFGAVGDGVADDTSAIQAALNAVGANGGRVYAPTGTYKITASLTFPRKVIFYGDGIGEISGNAGQTTLVKAASMTTPLLNISTNAVCIESVNCLGTVGNTGDGILIRANRVVLRDVFVSKMGQDGIRIGTDSGNENCNLWFIENVRSKENGRDGVRISEGSTTSADCNGGTFIGGDLQSNTGSGLYLGSTQLNTFVGVTSQTNGQYSVYLDANARYNTLKGGDWEGSSLDQLYIAAGAFLNSIENSTISAANCTLLETFNKLDILDLTTLTNGITFPPVQIPSTDPNTLDDYEENVWTPTVTFATVGDISVTYSTRVGRYTKIGRLVTAEFEIVTSAFTYATSSGNFRITGLPFVAAGNDTGSVIMSGWTLANVSSLNIQILGNVMQVNASRSGASVAVLTTSQIPSGSSIVLYGTISYNV
jgi:hypothetical protein